MQPLRRKRTAEGSAVQGSWCWILLRNARACVVAPVARGQGLMKGFYREMIRLFPQCHIYTRTWSTNMAHIKILQGFGFEELKRIPNHRGQGIDTVYYCKKHTS